MVDGTIKLSMAMIRLLVSSLSTRALIQRAITANLANLPEEENLLNPVIERKRKRAQRPGVSPLPFFLKTVLLLFLLRKEASLFIPICLRPKGEGNLCQKARPALEKGSLNIDSYVGYCSLIREWEPVFQSGLVCSLIREPRCKERSLIAT